MSGFEKKKKKRKELISYSFAHTKSQRLNWQEVELKL